MFIDGKWTGNDFEYPITYFDFFKSSNQTLISSIQSPVIIMDETHKLFQDKEEQDQPH